MGRALVLLATSCAALRTGVHPRGARSRGRSSAVALRYRDGDEDQPAAMRQAHQRALEETTATAPAPTTGATATRRPHFTLAWPGLPAPGIRLILPSLPSLPSRPPPSPPDETQLVMDEYLEFVEKRYSRQHPKHPKHPQHRPHAAFDLSAVAWRVPRKIFLSTLSLDRLPLIVVPTYNRAHDSPAPPRAGDDDDDDEEEPLHVLGLSGLASAGLRRRLHLHVPRDLRHEADLLSSLHLTHRAAAPVSRAPTSAPPSAGPRAAAGGRTSSDVALSCRAQLRLLVAALRRRATACAAAVRLLAAVAGRTAAGVATTGGCALGPALGGAGVLLLLALRPLSRGGWGSTRV